MIEHHEGERGQAPFPRIARLAGLVLLCVSILSFPPSPALAATYTVTNLNDSGAGSLRQAVLDANGTPDADTVTFSGSLLGVITLTSGVIAITGALTVSGPGAERITISGNAASRIFSLGITGNVTIEGLTLTNGKATSGGAVSNGKGNLTVRNCRFTSNTATGAGSSQGGGALFTQAGSCTVQSCVFSENETTGSAPGGAVNAYMGPITITGSTFSQNASVSSAGALACIQSSGCAVSGSTFALNTSDDPGGAIGISESHATITSSVFTGNSAQDLGGALHAGTPSDPSHTLTIQGCAFSENHTPSSGGALSLQAPTTLFLSAIHDNWATGSGGGVYLNNAALSIEASTISENSAAGDGGGLAALSTTAFQPLAILNSTFSGNSSAKSGGGIFSHQLATISFSTITENTANSDSSGVGEYGGGLNAPSGSLTLMANIIAENKDLTRSITRSPDCDVAAPFVTGGWNIVGNNLGCENEFPAGRPNASNDMAGTSAWPVLPLLGPLADNGGTLKTHLPAGGSPAVNWARECTPPGALGPLGEDSRGLKRPKGPFCDSGSVERPVPAFLPADTFLLGL